MRVLRLVVVNCLVFFALLEAAALIYYWQKSSGLFYLASPAPEPKAIVAAVNDPAWRPRAHPYFGFVYVPDPGAQLYGFYVNNHAFVQSAAYVKENPLCCDFPAKRTDKRDFIIGIFGGSVAASFAVTTQEARDFQPIDGRNVRVLNFASGGYKQPQQLLVLSYFLSLGQAFDAIINIDGFNELLSDGQRGPDLSVPGGAWQALVAAIDKDSNRAALVPFVHEYLRRELLTSGDHCRIAVCWALYYFAARYVEHRRAALPVSRNNEPSFFVPAGSAHGYDAIAERWATASLLMQDLAMQHGALYLHVLQPHRYVRPDPSFVARDPADEGLRDRVRDGYAAYRVHMNGVKVIDALQNFEETEKSLWATDCCHLSDVGNKRLREIVGKHISEFALNPKGN